MEKHVSKTGASPPSSKPFQPHLLIQITAQFIGETKCYNNQQLYPNPEGIYDTMLANASA